MDAGTTKWICLQEVEVSDETQNGRDEEEETVLHLYS